MKKIDIHCHTSNHKMWGLHTTDASLDALRKYANEFNVRKIVLLATYFPFKGTGLYNDELLKRIEGDDLFIAFASLDVMNNLRGGINELYRLAKAGKVKGIKLYPGYQRFHPSDYKVFNIYEIASQFNLPVMFHTGELHHCCPKSERDAGKRKCGHSRCQVDDNQYLSDPLQMLEAIKRFPRVKFILSHLGNPYFDNMRQLMIQCPNVMTDISGQFVSGSAEDLEIYRQQLQTELSRFMKLPRAIDRLMFGTDFPIQSYEDSIALVKGMNLSEFEQAKIFYGNAARILDL